MRLGKLAVPRQPGLRQPGLRQPESKRGRLSPMPAGTQYAGL